MIKKIFFAFGLLLLVLWLGFALNPGIMTNDSIDQLAQARAGVFSDWHPPLMAWLWSYLDRLLPGPMLFVGLNILFFCLAFSLPLFISGFSVLGSLGLALVFFLFPAFGTNLGSVWKDISFGVANALAASLMFGLPLVSNKKAKSAVTTLFFILIFWALSLRHNAAPALGPLVLGFVLLYFKQKSWSLALFLKQSLFSFVLLILMLFLSSSVSKNLANNNSSYPIQQILLQDIVGISIAQKESLNTDLLPQSFPKMSFEELKQVYTTDSVVDLYCCNLAPKHFPILRDPGDVAKLKTAWAASVRMNFGKYFDHRWRLFRNQIALGRKEVCWPFVQKLDGGIPWWQKSWELPYRISLRVGEVLKNSFIFRGYFWILLSTAALLFLFYKRKTFPINQYTISAVAVFVSGLCYVLPYLFVSTTCDFRMHWWTVLATCQGFLFLTLAKFKNGDLEPGFHG